MNDNKDWNMEIARFRSKLGAGDYFPLLNIGKMLKQCNSVCVSQLILLCVMASFAFRVSILCFDRSTRGFLPSPSPPG